MKTLTLVVGVIVVMTVNVDVEDGLTDGDTGVVKHIDYRMEGTNRPSINWVFDFHRKYFLVPADKAANNVVVV